MNVDGRCVKKQNRPLLPPSQVGSLCSDLCSAHCRLSNVQVVFRLLSLLKSAALVCPVRGAASAVRRGVACTVYVLPHTSQQRTVIRVGFFLSKTSTFAKETKNTTNAQKNTVACVLCRTESPARARPGGPWSNCIKLKINAVRCSLDRAGNRGWRQLISRRQTKNTKSN